LMMRSPEKRFPLLDMMPDIAHPDGFLNIPSLTGHTSNQFKEPALPGNHRLPTEVRKLDDFKTKAFTT